MKNWVKWKKDEEGRLVSKDKRLHRSLDTRRLISESLKGNQNSVGCTRSKKTKELIRTKANEKYPWRNKPLESGVCGFCAIRGCLQHVPVKHVVTGKIYYLLLLPASLTREFLNPEECRMRAHRAMHRQIAEHALKIGREINVIRSA